MQKGRLVTIRKVRQTPGQATSAPKKRRRREVNFAKWQREADQSGVSISTLKQQRALEAERIIRENEVAKERRLKEELAYNRRSSFYPSW